MKRKKERAIGMLLAFCMIFCLPLLHLQAAEPQPSRLKDEAGLLTQEEQQEISGKLDQISEAHQCDVVIMTVEGLQGKTAQAYADDAYDTAGYGFGEAADGILLLLDMQDRNWAMSTCGFGITAFTDAGLEYLEEQILPDLKEDDYAEAFLVFAEQCDRFLVQAESGEPYDVGNMPKEPFAAIFWLVLSLLGGYLIALITALIKKAKLTSVIKEAAAENYMKKEDLKLTLQQDHFLNKVITKRPIPKQQSSGGGSSVHTSSSGRSHGGRSGKF